MQLRVKLFCRTPRPTKIENLSVNSLQNCAFCDRIRRQNLHEELESPECVLDNRLIGIRRAEHGVEHMAAVRMDAGSVVRTGDHAENDTRVIASADVLR